MQQRFKQFPALKRERDRKPTGDEEAISARLPGEDAAYQEMELIRFWNMELPRWRMLSPRDRAKMEAHWREHRLRESLAARVQREHFEKKR